MHFPLSPVHRGALPFSSNSIMVLCQPTRLRSAATKATGKGAAVMLFQPELVLLICT
jgi:hypothetical protein